MGARVSRVHFGDHDLEDHPCESHDWGVVQSQGALRVNVIGTIQCANCMATPPTLEQLVDSYVENERMVKVGVAHLSGELDQVKSDLATVLQTMAVFRATLDGIEDVLTAHDAQDLTDAGKQDMLDLIRLARRAV
jgi:thiol-disulfide isomerase/thioredoxin